MIFGYLGKNVTPEQVALAIGRGPENFDDMIEFARRQGLEAEGYNNGTVEELKSFIDKGIPVMAGISSATDFGNDMITITGYGVDNQKDPPEEYIVYRDATDGTEKRMSMTEFQRRWADGGPPQGFDSGYKNYFMAFAPDGTDLPAGRDEGIEATSVMNTGISDMQAGWDRLVSGNSTIGDRIHGPFQMFAGGLEGLGGTLGHFLSGPGQWLNDKVAGIPVLENIFQPVGDILDTAGSVVADVFGGVGEAFDDFGNAWGCLADGDFSGFGQGLLDTAKDIGGAVVNTVVDTVEGVVDAVGDFFSGW
jgi:hypothetical protein